VAILAGIDEAGFGPLLGPLVVSASVFGVPDELADECLWRLLAGAVARKRFARSAALPVADSKALRVRSDGLVHLERGVLGMHHLFGAPPRTLREFLARLGPATAKQMDRYPWYAQADLPIPTAASAADVALRANALRHAMGAQSLRLENIAAECVLAGEYNRLVAATRNKSVALFGLTGKLIWRIFQKYGGREPTRIVADRQGGRTRYLPSLQRMFDGADIKIIAESDQASAYHVRCRGREAQIHFVTKGEVAHLPVALASMVSKYLRELFMILLNRWWAGRVQDLKPTAGYYVDGKRFLADIDAGIASEGIDRSLLIRSR